MNLREAFLWLLAFLIAIGFAGLALWLGAKAFNELRSALKAARMQRMAWVFAAFFVLVSFFCPPYYVLKSPFGATAFGGYAWLWNIPAIRDASVAWPLLLVQWIAIAMSPDCSGVLSRNSRSSMLNDRRIES